MIEGIGTITFDTAYTNTGTISPGLSAGKLHINDLKMESGKLQIEITGIDTAGTDYDQLTTDSITVFGGTLEVLLLDDYIPPIGSQFTILTSTTEISDTFNTINYPIDPSAWIIHYNTNDIILEVIDTIICDSTYLLPLEALYISTGGVNWVNNDSWLGNCLPCTWYGITCNGNNEIIEIDLSNNNLTGEIPVEITNLAEIQNLDLSNNQLIGFIPPELANLAPTLTSLSLQNNNLEGCFPYQLSALCSSAIAVDFSGNSNLANNGNFSDFCNNNEGACCASHPADPPPNDNCSTAFEIMVNDSLSSCNWNATYSSISGGVGCTNAEAELWFQFTVPNCTGTSQVSIGVNDTDFNKTQMELFSGMCGNLSSIDCDKTQGSSYPQEVLSFNGGNSLTPNTTYYIRVWGKDAGDIGSVEIYVNYTSDTGDCTEDCPTALHLTTDPLSNEVFQAADTMTSTVEIASGLDISYKSGEVIILKPPVSGTGIGFHAVNGSTFHAFIEDCSMSASDNVEERTREIVLSKQQHLTVYPNPFSRATTIEYELLEASEVECRVLDLTGKVVVTLISMQRKAQGKYKIEWLTDQQQAGIYFLQMRVGKNWITQKLILMALR